MDKRRIILLQKICEADTYNQMQLFERKKNLKSAKNRGTNTYALWQFFNYKVVDYWSFYFARVAKKCIDKAVQVANYCIALFH